jgi:membrane protein involved in colicin uptake
MDRREQTFLSALEAWETAEHKRIVLAEQYREAHARALSASQAKTDAARKAEADAATSQLRLDRNFAELAATSLRDRVIFYRGPAGERERGET